MTLSGNNEHLPPPSPSRKDFLTGTMAWEPEGRFSPEEALQQDPAGKDGKPQTNKHKTNKHL